MAEQRAASSAVPETGLKPVDRHLADILAAVRPLPPIRLGLLEAVGGVLADPVTATAPVPGFDNSAMDGYAVCADDLAGASDAEPVRLTVVADIAAGDGGVNAIRPGMCARIMTGAPLPAGADAVVPVEVTDGGVAHVAVRRPVERGGYVRRAGEDVRAGDEVLPAGTALGAAEIAAAAALGIDGVRVRPRPRVVVISTGAELVEPGRTLGPGQIYDSNGYMLTAAVAEVGGVGYRTEAVTDDPELVRDTIDDQLVRADAIITTGGVSMGVYDVVKEVLSRLGTVRFEKVAMQPGKPQGFGTVGDDDTPIFTLPGNPVSSYVSFQLFVRPALRAMRGLPPDPLPTVRATLTAGLRSPAGKRQFARARITRDDGGRYLAAPATGQGSHHLAALARSNALIVVPEWIARADSGDQVEVLELPSAEHRGVIST